MDEMDEMVWLIWEKTDSKGIKARCEYDRDTDTFSVQVTKDAAVRSSSFKRICVMSIPWAGIDALDDYPTSMMLAESMAQEIEKELGI